MNPSPPLSSPLLNTTVCTTALNVVTWLKYGTEQCWISACDCYKDILTSPHGNSLGPIADLSAELT